MDENPLAHIPEEDRQAMRAGLIGALHQAIGLGELNHARFEEILRAHVGPPVGARWRIPENAIELVNDIALQLARRRAEHRRQHHQVAQRLEPPQRPEARHHGEPPGPARVDPPQEAVARGHRELPEEAGMHRRFFVPREVGREGANDPAPWARPLLHPADHVGQEVGDDNANEQQQPADQAPLEQEVVLPHVNGRRINEFRLAREHARHRAQVNQGQVNENLQREAEEIPAVQVDEPRQPAGQGLEQELHQLGMNERLRLAQELEGARGRLREARRRLEPQRLEDDLGNPPQREHRLEEREGAQVNEQQIPALADRPVAPRGVGHLGMRADEPPVNEPREPARQDDAVPLPVAPIEPPPQPGLNQLEQEMGCRHQRWRKINEADQQCLGCRKRLPTYILECTNCSARRCAKCKRRVAIGIQ